jgi:hypothetical protein
VALALVTRKGLLRRRSEEQVFKSPARGERSELLFGVSITAQEASY